jgi:hypothetical protein
MRVIFIQEIIINKNIVKKRSQISHGEKICAAEVYQPWPLWNQYEGKESPSI